MKIQIENTLTNPNASIALIHVILVITPLTNAEQVKNAVRIMPTDVTDVFEFGFGGSHLWIKERTKTEFITPDRFAIVEFPDEITDETFPKFNSIPVDDVRSAKYYDNLELTESKGDDECFICGKSVSKNCDTWVHMTTDGMLVDTDTENPAIDSQGCFQIGSTCLKKLPSSFIFKFTL